MLRRRAGRNNSNPLPCNLVPHLHPSAGHKLPQKITWDYFCIIFCRTNSRVERLTENARGAAGRASMPPPRESPSIAFHTRTRWYSSRCVNFQAIATKVRPALERRFSALHKQRALRSDHYFEIRPLEYNYTLRVLWQENTTTEGVGEGRRCFRENERELSAYLGSLQNHF